MMTYCTSAVAVLHMRRLSFKEPLNYPRLVFPAKREPMFYQGNLFALLTHIVTKPVRCKTATLDRKLLDVHETEAMFPTLRVTSKNVADLPAAMSVANQQQINTICCELHLLHSILHKSQIKTGAAVLFFGLLFQFMTLCQHWQSDSKTSVGFISNMLIS